jgi:uncharacterized membrane protein
MFDFLVDQIGFSVCHQIPDRTLSFGSILMPVCARCSGIYIGFVISTLVLFLMYRKRQSLIAPVYIVIIFIVFLSAAAIDGILSYLQIYTTNNLLRLITGYMAGIALAAIVMPLFNYQYYIEPLADRILERPGKMVFFMFFTFLPILALIFKINFLASFFYYFNAFSVFFTFFFVNLIVLYFIPAFAKKASRFFSRYLVLPLLTAAAMAFLELFLSNRFHLFILKP